MLHLIVVDRFRRLLYRHLLCLWQIMNSLACLPPAAVSAGKSYSVVHGLNGAVEALCRPTQLQNQHRTALIADEPQHVSNHGRIICLTTLKRFSLISSDVIFVL